MAGEAGVGRDEANPAGTRVNKIKKKLMLKVVLATFKSLRKMNYAEVYSLMRS